VAKTAASRGRNLLPVKRSRPLVAAAIVFLGLAGSACHSTTASVGSPGADRPGQTYFAPGARIAAPALSGRTLTARSLSLDSLLGQDVVVLNVWASWCVECRAESKAFAVVARRLAGQPVRFIGIDEQDDAARARHFAASVGTRYPSIVDGDGRLLAKLALLPSTGIPSTLIVDSAGRMAARIVGTARREQLTRLIERVAGSE
jgi:thiol-disulfide isomerase/thioredoxin